MFVCLFIQRDTPGLVCDPFAQRNNPLPLFVTPSRISLSYLGSLFFLAARSGALLKGHSNAPALVFKEVKRAHAKAKTNLLQQKSECKKSEKYVR